MFHLNPARRIMFSALFLMLAVSLTVFPVVSAQQSHTSTPFQGKTVNGGTVTHTKQGRLSVLTLSDDFKVPDSPDPHWQVVDSKGNVYRLEKLTIKDDKVNRSITVPAYVPNVARVQIWCAWAEVLLGEASFSAPVK